MPDVLPDANFLNLPTQWSLLRQASDQKQWKRLFEYYHSAIAAYIYGATRNREHAQELVQLFAVEFLRGTFRHADREKGKFRHYLKASLSNFIRNHPPTEPNLPLVDSINGPVVDTKTAEQALDQEWEAKYLDAAWARLRAEQGADGPPYYDALRVMADNPGMTSEQLAERLSNTGKANLKVENLRQILKRSRHKFAEYLYEIVESSLDLPAPENVEEELAELKLLPYCKAIVATRKGIS